MLALLFLLAAAALPDGEIVAHGGELAGPPTQTVAKEAAEIAAYGFSEVPGNSRLQAALALADANARAELVKHARTRIEDSLKSHSTESSEQIEALTRELSHGLLPALELPQHGWRKLKRGSEIVLQVWARVSIPQSRFDELLQGALK